MDSILNSIKKALGPDTSYNPLFKDRINQREN